MSRVKIFLLKVSAGLVVMGLLVIAGFVAHGRYLQNRTIFDLLSENEKLRQAIEAGREIRPIVVSRMEDGTYRIVGDGRHRYEGHLAAGCEVIAARVV